MTTIIAIQMNASTSTEVDAIIVISVMMALPGTLVKHGIGF